jgi:hypothetical protein
MSCGSSIRRARRSIGGAETWPATAKLFLQRLRRQSRRVAYHARCTSRRRSQPRRRLFAFLGDAGTRYFEVAEHSLPGVGEEAAPGYSARVAMRALLGITYNLIAI